MGDWFIDSQPREPFCQLQNKSNFNELVHSTGQTSTDEHLSKVARSRINKLLNPELVDMSDFDLEILRMRPDHPLHSLRTFQEMPIPLPLLKAIASLGFYKPSMIQENCLPQLLSDNPPNMIAQAQSGTGKTATFLIAMLCRVNPEQKYCQCLCLVPTRELALQLVTVGRQMAKFMSNISFAAAIRDAQATTDENGLVTDQIVIGTPGTVASWLRGYGPFHLDPSFLNVFVLDEADVMIETEGFFNISNRIKSKLPPTCQLLLFSATFEDNVVEFAREFVPNAIELRMKRTQLPLSNIRQFHLVFHDWEEKYEALADLYGGFDVGQAIIFCESRKEASWLEGKLSLDGHKVALLSGELDVSEREAAIKQFRLAERRVLITTNLCARGLDIPQVNLIINWNMPVLASGAADCETYLHRIGRSGRFGKTGVAVNFLQAEEIPVLREIEHYFDITIPLLENDDLIDF